MPSLIVFEDGRYRDLLPLVYWRTVSELRVGCTRICDYIRLNVCHKTTPDPCQLTIYCRKPIARVAAERFEGPVNQVPDADVAILINARLLLTTPITPGDGPGVQWHDDDPIVIQADRGLLERLSPDVLLDSSACRRILAHVPKRTFVETPRVVRYPWHLINANTDMILWGWENRCTQTERGGRLCPGADILNEEAVCLGKGSTVKPGVVIDAEAGPVIVGQNATIMPNATLIGPCYIGDDAVVQPGAIIRDGTTIGPRCKVGGEITASIFQGYSNKQHKGFLGHSFVGEWVNLAADTINSNMKNTYGSVRVLINGQEVDTGQTFAGLTIGDHSKSGIGQKFTTGTVVGFGCNVAMDLTAPRFVPSFSWMVGDRTCIYDIERCIAIARLAMARRDVVMTDVVESYFRQLPRIASQYEKSRGT